VGEQGWIEREHLGEPLAVVPVLDCRVSFRRQLESNDLWCIVTGPLGTFAHNVLPEAVLRQVQRGRATRDSSRDAAARKRTQGWQQVRIEDDLTIALRAGEGRLSMACLFGDGAPFGGAETGLPTTLRPGLFDRVRSLLPGAPRKGLRVYRHA